MTNKPKLLALAEACEKALPRTLEEIHKRALDRNGRPFKSIEQVTIETVAAIDKCFDGRPKIKAALRARAAR